MTPKKDPPPERKRPYRTPTLKVHGDLKVLTKAKGGNRSDVLTPKTRTTGTP